ncbi:MAG: hypothetical protein IIV61_07575, partial [Oscillospiraceae bacterium]|nr:hypothetical protein [Oscillospiraceae bacterium]
MAVLLCAAILLAELAGGMIPMIAQAAATVAEAPDFDQSVLDGLVYDHGTVSAWLEYDCGNGLMTGGTNKSYMQVAVGTDYAHFQSYCDMMSRNTGYTGVYQDNGYGIVGDSTEPVAYGRYKAADGSHIVYVYILNAVGEVRVIVDTHPDMAGVYADGYSYESTTGETAQPMMVMYGLSMAENGYHIDTTSVHYGTDKVNSGALLVIRMPDNSLFINDGGSVEQWNDEACDRFLTFLREMTGKREGEKVVINTWFLSHAHTDHFEGFTRFVDRHHDQLELKNVMYNIDGERLGTARDLTPMLRMLRAYFPSVRYYKPHTGEHFDIAGIGFDVVYAQEDRFYPTKSGQTLVIDHLDGDSQYASHGSVNGTYREECFFETVYSYDDTNEVLVAAPTTYDHSDFNDTSTVLKVTFPEETTGTGDKTAILYGDVNRVDQLMLKIYAGTDMLKTDIILVPHHGHDSHPELVEAAEADVVLYAQRKSAIFGPNGEPDYGVDVGGTYRPALVYNYMAMRPYIDQAKRTYWQGTETVCLTIGGAAQALPSGMARDESLDAATGLYGYTCDAISFRYDGWSLLTQVSGGESASATGVGITTSRIRFDQVTSLKNGGRYMIVHDQSDKVLMYDAIARDSGQTRSSLATSMEVGSGLAASNGLVDAYYKVADTSQPDVETKTSIYCTRDKRDLALWILGQEGASGTTLKTATAKFGGTTAYSATTMYKGTSPDDSYWYCVAGNDYVDSSKGDQWRYLRVSSSPLFQNAENFTNWIEFFEDGTCVIYYYESSSSIRFLSVTPEGNWVRSKKTKTSQVTGELLDSLKLRVYEYKTRTGAKTIAYNGPTSYEVLKDTSKSDIVNDIAATFQVIDSSARNRPIPCSGTKAKVGYYWLDGTVSASSVTTSTITLKYRDDDGTDAVICTITLDVQDRLYMDTVLSGTSLTVLKGETGTDGKVCKVWNGADGYVTEDTAIVLDMLKTADGGKVSSADVGVQTGLVLTYDGQVLSDDITLTVAAKEHSYTPVVTAPTCTEDGYTTYTCTDCGDSYVTDQVPAVGHDFSDGSCANCGQACAHHWSASVCTVCGAGYPQRDYYLFGFINGSDHACEGDHQNLGDYKFVDGKLTAVFNSDSYVAVKSGDNQDWYMTYSYVGDGTTTAVLGNTKNGAGEKMFVPGGRIIEFTLTHNGDDTFTLRYTATDCTHEDHDSDGRCTVCGAQVGHSYESNVIKPGCTTGGYTVKTCTVCGYSYSSGATSPVGHRYDAVVTTPTCEEEGYTTYTCTGCGDSYVGDRVAATGHSHRAVVTAPTCTEDGHTTYTCACGDTYVADRVAAAGHDYSTTVTDPTCTEPGSKAYHCRLCGDHYTEQILPDGHSYMSVVTAPACTTDGYTTYICIVCGDRYTSDPVPATGHSYENGSCTGCGQADPEAVKDPGLVLSYPTLSFEDEIIYNVYFSVKDTSSIVEMGLMVLPKMDQNATIADAVALVPGYVTNGVVYLAKSEGIPAAN